MPVTPKHDEKRGEKDVSNTFQRRPEYTECRPPRKSNAVGKVRRRRSVGGEEEEERDEVARPPFRLVESTVEAGDGDGGGIFLKRNFGSQKRKGSGNGKGKEKPGRIVRWIKKY
jgi:hypothetical protein